MAWPKLKVCEVEIDAFISDGIIAANNRQKVCGSSRFTLTLPFFGRVMTVTYNITHFVLFESRR